ncbi:PLP-dependent aminotransferase family protein [Methylotenera sp.]|uniref:MocR-like pyridoxine biosynthesis transcription factor PdxR n=1 Tax=Methylotenera sp. TaxID=2051956 RepID=UPI002736372F|nr:PLP-dependent aminotransferase family protein [Methylotenera sp.]MDP3777668.1 PLP-dependent aminotransferase family protein [Methylotenera sp.]
MASKAENKYITLSKSTSQSIHVQIYTRFKESIESNLLKNGDRVPSSRSLASELNVSRGTVENAYSMLLGEGVFISKGQAGTFVNVSQALINNIKKPLQTPLKKNKAATSNSSSQITNNCSHVFLPGCPAYDAFPRKIWTRLATNRMRRFSANEMSYNDPMGYLPLRESIASYLRISRGVACDAEQVVITNGYQGALDLICKTLKLTGENVWMEDPGYIFATKLLEDIGAKITRVPVDEDGMIVSFGVKNAGSAKLAIVTPSHHSPLGMTLSWSRRTELLEWASIGDSWIVEDDYDGEYRYSGYPLPSLKSLDQYDRVIYAGSFSKTLFPSLRLGYVVIPQKLVDEFTKKLYLLRANYSFKAQLIVNDFIAEGHFSKHLNKMRGLYAERRELTSQCLTEILGERINITANKNGMHFVAKLNANDSDVDISKAFNELGHGIHPLSNWTSDPNQKGLIIGFTNVINKKTAELAAIGLRDCFVR